MTTDTKQASKAEDDEEQSFLPTLLAGAGILAVAALLIFWPSDDAAKTGKDGSRDKDARCWIGDQNGKNTTFRNSGQKYALTPGSYTLTGWRQKGSYSPVNFDLKAGEEKTLYLKAR